MGKRGMDRRRPRRVKAARHRVSFLGADVYFTGEAIDLSATGVLVRCSQALGLDTRGQVEIQTDAEPFRAFVAVRRVVPKIGIAFQFIDLDPHERELLNSLILRLSPPTGPRG